MKNLFIRLVALLGAAMAVHGVSAQEPQKHEAELRFDQAQREELADEPFPAVAVDSAVAGRPFAYKYNRANEMCTFYKRNVQKKDFFSRQTKSV